MIKLFGAWAAAALVITIWLTGRYRKHAIKQGIIDNPDHRSSHTLPTPTGGGVVAVGAIILLWLVAYSQSLLSPKETIALIAPGLLLAAIGFCDDRRPLAQHWRLGGQILAVCSVLALLYPLPELALTQSLSVNLNGWLLPLVAAGLIWLVNLYNFMDGIDGLAAGEAITVLAGGCLLALATNNAAMATVLAITAVPLFGFLVWNWPPAKIFMGDACSTFLGLSLGTLAIIASKHQASHLLSWMVLLMMFIADASYTLLVRMGSGQAWRSPHRSHFYQKYSRRLNSHQRATMAILSINIVVLIPLAYAVNSGHCPPIVALIASLMLTAALCIWVKAGKPD